MGSGWLGMAVAPQAAAREPGRPCTPGQPRVLLGTDPLGPALHTRQDSF